MRLHALTEPRASPFLPALEAQMSTRDCTPQRFDRVDPREGRDRAEMPAVDRVALLREGASINRYMSAAAERFLPSVTIDQRFGGNVIRCDGEQRRNGGDPRLDFGNAPGRFDPRYGADPRNFDPRNGGDPRLDPRNGGDSRYGGDPRSRDPRYGADPRTQNGRDDANNRPPDGQMQNHTVQKGDSLWKLARNALRQSGQPAGARDIISAIQGIVEANKAEHPSLASNPNLIVDGWHLKIPLGGQDAANRDGRPQDRSQDLYQYGGDQRRGRTRYDGGDAYFDQNPYQRDRNNQFDQNRYQRSPYERNPYERGPNDRNPYERPPAYNQDAANQPMNPLSMALREAALLAARGMQTIGRCAAGVQVALAKIGHSQFMGSGNAWDMGNKMARSGKFDQLPLSEAREGDIIVRSWNRGVINQHGGKNWGDIVVVTSKDGRGNLMGANDHHGRIPADGGRYCNSYVLRCRA
ncbi:hypothetical protein BH10CYA1_BH10CYA1_08160 [soil metagenome]